MSENKARVLNSMHRQVVVDAHHSQSGGSISRYAHELVGSSCSDVITDDLDQNERIVIDDLAMRFPGGVGFDAWSRAGCQLSGVLNSSAWWLGDWLVFGKKHFADRYQRGIEKAGLSYKTLRNYAWVARRFSPERRRPGLTFQHHAEVASLPEEMQDQLLRHAEEEGWTTKQLRAELDEVGRGRPRQPDPGKTHVSRYRPPA